MIEFNAQFWCEFVLSLAPALVVWGGGYAVFIRGRRTPISFYQETAPLPSPEMGEIKEFSADFLRELVRLAEERMRELEQASRVYERKAMLMVSLSFAVLGYFSSNISAVEVSPGVWSVIVYLSFGLVAVLGVKAIDFAPYEPRGQHPTVVRDFFTRPASGDEMNWMLYHLLDSYRKRIDNNTKTNFGKFRNLHFAKYLLALGAGGIPGMLLSSSEISARICGCLAN